LDLHYSHKDPAVIALLKVSNIIVVFIPAGCTDLHQVCDVVVNKPYKNGVTSAFVDHCSAQYDNWKSLNNPSSVFSINLAMSAMKPLMQTFVDKGLATLTAQRMQECIKACFLKEGLVELARGDETYQRALQKYPQDEDDEIIIEVPQGIEAEENIGNAVEEDARENNTDEVNVASSEDTSGTKYYDVELFPGGEEDNEEGNKDDESDEDSEEEPTLAPPPAVVSKRGRSLKPNSMIGGVKKGKYSKK